MDLILSSQRARFLSTLGTALPAAVVVTASLMFLMYSLIATDYIEPKRSDPRIDFSAFEPSEEPSPPQIKKLEQLEPETPPARVPTDLAIDDVILTANTIDMTWEPRDGKMTMTKPNSGPIPSFRVEPTYPARALQKGIEGYVDLMFDISSAGKTENIRVIGGQPARIFDRAAVKAVARWKYQPEYLENETIKSVDQVTRLVFEIED